MDDSAIRRADPSLRRRALWLVVGGAIVGALVILGFRRNRDALHDWLAEPGQSAFRLRLVFATLAVFLVAPLLGFSGYLWWLGTRVIRAREFPPPGYRVARDTPVSVGAAAITRGYRLRLLAGSVAAAAVVLLLLLWRVASVFHAAPD